jgi:autotransporter family porin
VLPTGAECARWVRESPEREIRPGNWRANHTTGRRVGAHFLTGDKPAADQRLAPRINGHFTGTTEEILRWAACKWGINQDVVFAQAAVESWWRQSTLGHWGTNGSACPAGHKPTAQHPRCAQSYGILQNRYPYEKSAWPAIGDSTAMSADTAYAVWRACYDGDETWLNTVQHVGHYHRGDMWGCVGRWFADRWYTLAAQAYIARVQAYLHEHIWLTRSFRRHNVPIVVLPNPGGSLRPA